MALSSSRTLRATWSQSRRSIWSAVFPVRRPCSAGWTIPSSWNAMTWRPPRRACRPSLQRSPKSIGRAACSRPPEGRARWTIELLAGEIVRLTEHDGISRETVRRRLAENELKPWREKMWCVPKIDGEYVARMENVLDLYAEPPDPKCPVVCLDESPV